MINKPETKFSRLVSVLPLISVLILILLVFIKSTN